MSRKNKPILLSALHLVLSTLLLTASAHAGLATEQIKATVDKALVVLRDPRFKPADKVKERREQLKNILFARFDFTEMAKRSLGAAWRRRTPQEQAEFVRLFTEVLEKSYAGIIESYSVDKIDYLDERIDADYADVHSKILASDGREYTINYKARRVGDQWKVYDVVAENISLVNNYRSQFTRVISKDSYEELVRRLKDKSDETSARTR